MSSSFGERVKVTLFGQSHSANIGVVIDGLPAGERIDLDEVDEFLRRRAPGVNKLVSKRRETDIPSVVSGFLNGRTCGAPLCATFENIDADPSGYEAFKDTPRPSHADYPAAIKYSGYHDINGSGHFSGRLTAPLCFAGAVCMQILSRYGVTIGAHILSVGGAEDIPFHPTATCAADLRAVLTRELPVVDEDSIPLIQREILLAAAGNDSIGGIIECCALDLPVGLGEPIFDGIESRLSAAVFAIPAVRGVDFGAGFSAAGMTGSFHNDIYRMENDKVVTATNNHGGVLGGLTTGMPLLFRAAFKPTPSIAQEQGTVNLSTRENCNIIVNGRHDPCVVLRAVPAVEAAAAIVLLDYMV